MTLLEKMLLDEQNGVDSTDVSVAVAIETANIEDARASYNAAVEAVKTARDLDVTNASQKVARLKAVAGSTPSGSDAVSVIKSIIAASQAVAEAEENLKQVEKRSNEAVANAESKLAIFEAAAAKLFAEVA